MSINPKKNTACASLFEEAIAAAVSRRVTDRDAFFGLVREACRRHGVPLPPVRRLRAAYCDVVSRRPKLADPTIESFLIKSRARSLSGVAVVTVLTKPFPCPGRCVYCPTERAMPKSYLSNEPAAMRAASLKFDPYAQVAQRLQALEANGHAADKIELIVKGGTWSAYPWDYRREFIRQCFEACNDFAGRRRRPSADLAEAQRRNESAGHRIVGLTLETRPDWVTRQEILRLRELGCTRIELGVQSLDDGRLRLCRRGHGTAAVIQATRLLKDAGYKTDYHIMPQLPGATPKSDLDELLELFRNPNYRPDMLKIYPCTVLENSELHKWWRDGRYKPYSTEKLKSVIAAAKTGVPRYCRISRIIRDIPSTSIVAGNVVTSLRQDIQRDMRSRGVGCSCLRCREVGRHPEMLTAAPVLFDDTYEASGGTEHFLSIEDAERKVVFAFCRLRLPPSSASAPYAHSIPAPAFVRELHTYGHLVPIDEKNPRSAQHHGHGRRLMAEAERVAAAAGYREISVISGVGVRAYYRKLGYRLKGTYMVKKIAV